MSEPLNRNIDLNTEAKYTQTVLDHMGDSVFVKDSQSRLILVNDAFCKMMDMSREEIIGKTLAEDVRPEERDYFLKVDRQVLNDGIENISEESITVRGAQTKIISTRKSRYIDERGDKFLICVVRDVTGMKKAEKQLQESEAQLREIAATKDKLLSIIAHDLRSPFNNISLLSDLLNDSVKKNDVAQSKEYLTLIDRTTKNSLNLLDNLLNWAKSQTGQIDFRTERTCINQIIEETLELSSVIASTKGITLNYDQEGVISVNSDHKIIRTVVRNLVSNAIKFTKPGGHINVSSKAGETYVEITVSDNGVGMSEDTCQKLFGINTNMACVGTANEKGSGFGLVLCKEFVEKLGGEIWAESTFGKGSDFKFTIPLNISE
ncbi:PAS domain-containing sensor histidine kinase [Zobellia sp. B3R18]|uniref:PAS domain-containing sensor histidine kinase n=1 Tax=Zobellia sp. B3R18 TaxID=2841568 RepID=UPI001C079E86|nr:PAS domain-containing sensor histidine kinase [Zobellia sp. B3R18]MBU2975320.1 PAS domain-containing sensor histidine kinase [Zobellia sp. B3R18]